MTGRIPRRPPAPTSSTVHLRPHGATILSIAVWALCAGLQADAFLRIGLAGARTLPFLLLAAVLVWVVLWAPRLVLRQEEVEVRNVWTTSRLPFAAITAVRIGAMVRFDARGADGDERTVTAWNAPGIGRDHPRERLGSIRAGAQGARQGAAAPRRAGAAERLSRDQGASRSAIVRERWDTWADRHEAEAGQARAPRTTANVLSIGLLAAALVAVVLRVAL